MEKPPIHDQKGLLPTVYSLQPATEGRQSASRNQGIPPLIPDPCLTGNSLSTADERR